MPDCRWIVIHQFLTGIEVRNPVPAYEKLGISLHYKYERLIRVEHELQCDDSLEPHEVVSSSHEHLKLFWELLRYRRGISLPSLSSHATKVEPVTNLPAEGTGFIGVPVSVVLVSSILMPDPEVFSEARSRLLAWLRLANDALDSSDINAIRNYYMIWEDSHPGWKTKHGPTEATNLKLTRDFVSHGEELGYEEVLAFIQRNLEPDTKQFDPTDRAQQRFVSSQRKSARSLIEEELDRVVRDSAKDTHPHG